MPVSSPPNDAGAGWPAALAGAQTLAGVPRALRLGGLGGFWQVTAGAVDLFAVEIAADGRSHAPWRSLGRVGAGAGLGGLPAAPGELDVIAVALPDTRLRRPEADDVAALFDGWVARVVGFGGLPLVPRGAVAIAPGLSGTVAAGTVLVAEGPLVWLTASGPLLCLDGEPEVRAGEIAALSPGFWARCPEGAALRVRSSAELAAEGRLEAAAAHVAVAALRRLAAALSAQAPAASAAFGARERAQAGAVQRATAALAGTLGNAAVADAAAGAAPLAAAMVRVLAAGGVEADPAVLNAALAAAPSQGGSVQVQAETMARAAGVRLRAVRLSPGWWRGDSGPVLVFDAQGPLAAVRHGGTYRLTEADGRQCRLTAALAEGLSPQAFVFFRPFPEGTVDGRALLRFALAGQRTTIAFVLVAALAGAILGLLTPAVTGAVFDFIVPRGQYGTLVTVIAVLAGAAVGGLGLAAVQTLSQLRLQGRIDAAVQAAVWDRLLRLPAAFFRRFEVGDLASRAAGINAISSQLTGATLGALFGGAFAVASFGLMAWYRWPLALAGLAIVLLTMAGSVLFARAQLRRQREQLALRGALAARVFQYIAGITRLRTAGAEAFAFGDWAGRFARDMALQRQSGTVLYVQSLFSSAMLLVFQGLVLAMVAGEAPRLSIGDFIAFNAAFGQFFAGFSGLAGALVAVSGLAPLYERTRPILEEKAEMAGTRADPGELSGAVRLEAVSFGYPQSSRPVLEDIGLSIAPGEFVAVVGSSGAGKSTLLRLLLGFEAPVRGAVFFDGRDLATLDPAAVRRQIGIVLQNGQLLPGSIFDNIVANGPYGSAEAWDAACMAGLADDIAAMPMGMETMIGEGGSTFSGGQRQRLLIARALIRRPRLLLLDEATSALDNATQAHITAALGALHTTRLVIAHRLSTIAGADRIVVLEQGRIVQQGRFAELMAVPGPFAALAQRQLS